MISSLKNMEPISTTQSRVYQDNPSQSQYTPIVKQSGALINEIRILKKSLTHKNRQINTLNRIIRNLRNQVQQLSTNANTNQQQLEHQKKTIKQLNKIIQQKQQKQMALLKKQEEILDKLMAKSVVSQQKQIQINKINQQKLTEHLNIIQSMKYRCQELETQNMRLGMEIELKSEHQRQLDHSRVSDNSRKLLTQRKHKQSFKYSSNKKSDENPFRGFLKSQTQQQEPLFNMIRRSRNRSQNNYYHDNSNNNNLNGNNNNNNLNGNNNNSNNNNSNNNKYKTWCKIEQLMAESFEPSDSFNTPNNSKNYHQPDNFIKNKSQLDAESAIQMIRQENQRIKISLR